MPHYTCKIHKHSEDYDCLSCAALGSIPCLVHEDLGAKAGALRHDTGKVRMELLPPLPLEGTAAVLAFGAKKYGEHNWMKGMKWSRAIGSLLRHLYLFIGGEELDKESGLPHIDHVACNAMFLQQYYRKNKDLDDRNK